MAVSCWNDELMFMWLDGCMVVWLDEWVVGRFLCNNVTHQSTYWT